MARACCSLCGFVRRGPLYRFAFARIVRKRHRTLARSLVRSGYIAPQPPKNFKRIWAASQALKTRSSFAYAVFKAPRITYKTTFSAFAGVCPGVSRYPVARCPHVAAARLAPCLCGVAYWRAKPVSFSL